MPYTTPYLGSIGAEQLSYLDYGQEKIVKNRGLDHLDEIRLIMGIRESGIPWESWERYFTTYPVGKPPEAGSPEGESRLNINLATEEEIIEFLNRFDQDRIPSLPFSTTAAMCHLPCIATPDHSKMRLAPKQEPSRSIDSCR